MKGWLEGVGMSRAAVLAALLLAACGGQVADPPAGGSAPGGALHPEGDEPIGAPMASDDELGDAAALEPGAEDPADAGEPGAVEEVALAGGEQATRTDGGAALRVGAIQLSALPCAGRNAAMWWGYRHESCNQQYVELYAFSKDAVGFADFRVTSGVRTSYDYDGWTHFIVLEPLFVSQALEGATVRVSARCLSRFCSPAAGNGTASGTLRVGARIEHEAVFDAHSVAGRRRLFASAASFHFSQPGFHDSNAITLRTPAVRCDRVFAPAGCVAMKDYAPWMNFDSNGPYPQVAGHIKKAQAAGLPGSFASKRPLRRMTNTRIARINRAVACPRPWRPPTSNETCDEYPFASTYEGAATGPGVPIGLPGCNVPLHPPSFGEIPSYSPCFIDGKQNSNAGSQVMQPFYRTNRLLDRDRFYVNVDPPSANGPPGGIDRW